jgi:amidase
MLPLLFLLAQSFPVEETTISQVHEAFRSKQLTCRALVNQYLARITTYDKNGPAINSLILINPNAESEAIELDRRFAASGLTGPLHCIPTIVKDNMETTGLATTNGALVFSKYIPQQDAFQVARIKQAGAIVLAKSSLAEWAFSPYETVNSVLPGYTKNPYALDRVSAGSSGGTAAAVAANLGLIGLGSDTGNSIRGPSSHQSLVGIRSTMGLTSRAGVFPLSIRADIAGPMTRTVEDAARLFNVIVGKDPNDPVTVERPTIDYTKSLQRDALRGTTIGILRQAYERESTDPEVVRVFQAAIEDLRRAGATIVDPLKVEGLDTLRSSPGCMGFKYDINQFLAARKGQVPVADLTAIIKSNQFHPNNRGRLESADKGTSNGPDSPECKANDDYRQAVRQAVLKTMDALKLDALVYPTWSNPPRLIGDLNTPHGDNSQFFSPTTGFPAINVPMGYTRGNTLPIGLTLLGRPWSESTLIGLAYSYEQLTHHRRPPTSTPPLR